MVYPVHPSDSAGDIAPSGPSENKRKLFEIQFQTAVIGAYVAITGENGSISQQLSKLKDGLQSGAPADKLANGINLLISQINGHMAVSKANFPTFRFTSEGSETQALMNHGISLEKLLNAAAEKGHVERKEQEKLFGELSDFILSVGQMTSEQAYNKLNGLVDQVNDQVPGLQLPSIPFF
jgi:hypothetical protein